IFTAYSEKLSLTTLFQDAFTLVSAFKAQDQDLLDNLGQNDQKLILLDNAFSIFRLLPKILSFDSDSLLHSPKIIAIMDSTEFEIYRRFCIIQGDRSYRCLHRFPRFSDAEIEKLLLKRVLICNDQEELASHTKMLIRNIAPIASGNPGLAIRILSEVLTFTQTLEEIQFSFGLDPTLINDFPPSKAAILREILIREVQKTAQLVKDQDYLIHKELTTLMNKTKSTISHHLGDLLNRNLIYEQPTTRDRRVRAYRPNSAIFGILEQLAFETSSFDDIFISTEGIKRE
ncbi:MAG: hypothetical protein EAX86_07105, partial [Candidatus Heimdallarchaeota archaeon]|nr:hypothetical protein [Candidatus Heimdallarchaeota archaeon]